MSTNQGLAASTVDSTAVAAAAGEAGEASSVWVGSWGSPRGAAATSNSQPIVKMQRNVEAFVVSATGALQSK
jgi:hypothetical protein